MLYFLKNGVGLFKKKQEDVLSAAFVIGLSVALSKVLGLVRYRMLAANFGGNIKLLDSFIAASVLPDAIFEVLIFGTIALAFIPVFSKYLSKDKLERAWVFSSTMIILGLLIFVIFAGLIMIFANPIASLLAPGLISKYPETRILIARLLRIMIISQLFFVVSIFLTGILQSFQRFLIPAIASVFYNIGIILAIIFLVPVFGIYAPAIGMILGALLHLIVQLPLVISLGFRFRFNLDFKAQDIKETFILVWPRSIDLGLTRISDMVNIALASLAAVGSIVAFNFAQVLQLVPTAFFATPIAQAAFPALSIEFNAERKEQFKKLFLESFHQVLYLVFLTSAVLAILRVPVVRLVFGARELPWNITVLTGQILVAFSIGIVAQSLGLLLTRGFYAIRDSMTPIKINSFAIAINIIMSLVFIFVLHLSVVWLAFAYSSTNVLSCLMLLYFLDRKIGAFDRKMLLVPPLKMFIITIITAVSLYIPMKVLDQLIFDTTRTLGLILLTSVAALSGLFVYISLSFIFKVEQVSIFWNFTKKILVWPATLMAPAPTSIEAQEHNP